MLVYRSQYESIITGELYYPGNDLLLRNVISAAFSGKEKKTLYVVGSGALGPDGKEITTPPGVRNNAKTIYKIEMVASGFKGRAK